ncbi:MAG: nickel pincer cofactor biosynthesis protein LarB [Opitutaceae bacterium]
MLDDDLLALLKAVKTGTLSAPQALDRLKAGPFRQSDLGFARPDHHRRFRHGLNEVVYGESKTMEHILGIVAELSAPGAPVLITRLQPEKLAALKERFPSGRANPVARTFVANPPTAREAGPKEAHVAIVAAGTSDLPVAEEACEVCFAMETPFVRITDVGVSGLHRLLGSVDKLQAATALVVIAGMEGALPSIVAGLVGRPVFAVPTSVGYGASFGGVTALLAMLNSCAPGVTVSNIDNGFSAAFAACQVVRAVRDARPSPK